jgi:hypothetical protein
LGEGIIGNIRPCASAFNGLIGNPYLFLFFFSMLHSQL